MQKIHARIPGIELDEAICDYIASLVLEDDTVEVDLIAELLSSADVDPALADQVIEACRGETPPPEPKESTKPIEMQQEDETAPLIDMFQGVFSPRAVAHVLETAKGDLNLAVSILLGERQPPVTCPSIFATHRCPFEGEKCPYEHDLDKVARAREQLLPLRVEREERGEEREEEREEREETTRGTSWGPSMAEHLAKVTDRTPVPAPDRPKRVERKRGATEVSWLSTGDQVAELYSTLREEAAAHCRVRNTLFAKATERYLDGDGLGAKALSKKGREHAKRASELHAQASEMISETRNRDLPLNVQDLHGQHPEEAVKLVQERMDALGKGPLYVIVGTGHHGVASRSKVGEAVQSALQRFRVAKISDVSADGLGGLLEISW